MKQQLLERIAHALLDIDKRKHSVGGVVEGLLIALTALIENHPDPEGLVATVERQVADRNPGSEDQTYGLHATLRALFPSWKSPADGGPDHA